MINLYCLAAKLYRSFYFSNYSITFLESLVEQNYIWKTYKEHFAFSKKSSSVIVGVIVQKL